MNFQNNRYTLRFADCNDDEGIRSVFESESFHGNIDVKFLRNPHPYASFKADGDEAKILIIKDNENNRTVAVGGAVLRMEYVNGKKEKCAYLTGLKVHPEYRKKISFIAKAYEFLHENIRDCGYCYTTILDGNEAAIKMFEKKRRNMPEYKYLGHYTTYCFHGGKKAKFALNPSKDSAGFKNKLIFEKENPAGFDRLMDTYFSKQSIVPCNTDYPGFGEKTFYCVRENNEIIACCYVGNQQESKQYKMCAYGGIYKLLSHLPTDLFGYPKLPKPDCVINHGVVSYLYIKDNDKKLCADFLYSVAKESGFALLIWGGFENNPLCSVLESMKTVRYGSRLYSVAWENDTPIHGVIGMEAALL